jgi:hypothetical protein
MSTPRIGALIDALRLIVLDGDTTTLRKSIIAHLVRRRWVRVGKRKITVTPTGHRVLAKDGDDGEFFAWLKSDIAKSLFQK